MTEPERRHLLGALTSERHEGRWWDCYPCRCGWKVLAHRSRLVEATRAGIDHLLGITEAEQVTGFLPRPLVLDRLPVSPST